MWLVPLELHKPAVTDLRTRRSMSSAMSSRSGRGHARRFLTVVNPDNSDDEDIRKEYPASARPQLTLDPPTPVPPATAVTLSSPSTSNSSQRSPVGMNSEQARSSASRTPGSTPRMHRSQPSRPATSPSLSTPDYSPLPTPTIIQVTSDLETYKVVHIGGATNAAFIRERIFATLLILDDDQAQFSIYQTEIGSSYPSSMALPDVQLFDLCRQAGGTRGNLHFLVQHSSAPMHNWDVPPSSPIPTALPVPPSGPFSPGGGQRPRTSPQYNTGFDPSEGYEGSSEAESSTAFNVRPLNVSNRPAPLNSIPSVSSASPRSPPAASNHPRVHSRAGSDAQVYPSNDRHIELAGRQARKRREDQEENENYRKRVLSQARREQRARRVQGGLSEMEPDPWVIVNQPRSHRQAARDGAQARSPHSRPQDSPRRHRQPSDFRPLTHPQGPNGALATPGSAHRQPLPQVPSASRVPHQWPNNSRPNGVNTAVPVSPSSSSRDAHKIIAKSMSDLRGAYNLKPQPPIPPPSRLPPSTNPPTPMPRNQMSPTSNAARPSKPVIEPRRTPRPPLPAIPIANPNKIGSPGSRLRPLPSEHDIASRLARSPQTLPESGPKLRDYMESASNSSTEEVFTPSSPSHSRDDFDIDVTGTFNFRDHPGISELLSGNTTTTTSSSSDGTSTVKDVPTSLVTSFTSFEGYGSDETEGAEEGDEPLFQEGRRRDTKRISRVPHLTVETGLMQPPPSDFPHPGPPPALPSSKNKGHQKRLSAFVSPESNATWLVRPRAEDVYDRLEEFFSNHDVDKPILESPSGSSSPTSQEHTATIMPQPREHFRHKKSIRIVATERKKAIDRDRQSKLDPWNVFRKRSTKLWGSRVEEFKPSSQSPQSIPPVPPAPTSPSQTREPIFRWVRGDLIGKGTYGRVYLALNLNMGEMIAVKQVEIPQTVSDQDDEKQTLVISALRSESATLKDLDHPNIVMYLGFEETPSHLSIFLEYVPGGSIGTALRKHGKFNPEVTKSFASQIVAGLEYLHDRNIIHRDMKTDNILVDHQGVCKISDFGISTSQQNPYADAQHTVLKGTIFYMAPEVLKSEGNGYNARIDIWSLGCILLEMWAGTRPWTDQQSLTVMFKLINDKEPPPIPPNVQLDEDANDFRLKCFMSNPEERPTAAELKSHPYLTLRPDWEFTTLT